MEGVLEASSINQPSPIAEKLDSLADIKNEIARINELEEKGNSKEATAASGRIIRQIKEEIRNIKGTENVNAQDLEVLEKLEVALDNQLEWHKNQLAGRYKNEFSKKPATVGAIFTALPKGIAIQAQKVVNCINQLKEAKTNKERIFKVLEIGKEIGALVLTPVTFTARFIVKHWYLLLLLLLLLKLPGFKFNPKTEPSYDKDPELQPEPEPEYEPVTSPAHEPVTKPVTKPGFEPFGKPGDLPVKEPGADPDPVTPPVGVPEREPEGNPGFVPKPGPAFSSDGAQPETDTGTGTPYTDPVTQPQPVSPITPEEIVSPEITEEEEHAVHSIADDFVENLERNYRFFVHSNHEDVIVVHSAEDYVREVHNINSTAPVTIENAEEFYQMYRSPVGSVAEQPIVWPEADPDLRYFESTGDLAEHVLSGEDQYLTEYYTRYVNQNAHSESFNLLESSPIVEQVAITFGVSLETAILLYALYKAGAFTLLGPAAALTP